ncbi:hypothetical protein [Brevundimonas sp.]|uniref:hypothetical protein n=1 Tax=Brevundimonas sp. TaxID=1871086 RepID=UPI003BAC64AF
MKSVLILALGATVASAGAAYAGDVSSASVGTAASPYASAYTGMASGLPFAALGLAAPMGSATTVAMAENERWGGNALDRNCECNLPTVNVPFYTVRPTAPPIRVRAPGIRVSSAPVFAPSPAIYIQGPPIYVDAPPVNVAPAQVYLEAPDVHVRPSEVNVAPPEIHFTPAAPGHPDEHCCDVASPPSAQLNVPPPSIGGPIGAPVGSYNAPLAPVGAPAAIYAPVDGGAVYPVGAPASSSGYAQEPGERG